MTLPDNPYHLHEFTHGTATAYFGRYFDEVEVRSSIIPPWKLNRKTGSTAYRLKAALQWINYPITRIRDSTAIGS